jgi:hypothetical protein
METWSGRASASSLIHTFPDEPPSADRVATHFAQSATTCQLPRLLPSSFFDGIDFEQRTAGARRRERNSGPARSVRAAADSKDFCTHFYTLRTGGMRESMIRDKMKRTLHKVSDPGVFRTQITAQCSHQ